MAAGRSSGERATSAVLGHVPGLVFAITLGVAGAADAEPVPNPAQRSLQDTAWVLYQVNDAQGNAVAPFADGADRSRTIVPVLFRADYLEFATACGRQVAPYREQGERIVIAQAYASHDSCRADAAIAPLIGRLRGEFVVSFVPIAGMVKPSLRLKAPSGEEFLLYANGQLRFTDPDDVLPQPRAMYLQVGPDTMGCGYNGPDIPGQPKNVCVVASPVKQGADGAWLASPTPSPVMPAILGFAPPAGSRSIVRILRYELAHPDIHASLYRDVLDVVIEQHLPGTPSADDRNPPNYWIP